MRDGSVSLCRIQSRVAGSREELVLLYVCMLRALGLDVRLVLSLQPMTYKAADLEAVSTRGAQNSQACPSGLYEYMYSHNKT